MQLESTHIVAFFSDCTRRDGQLVIFDWKTSNSLYAQYALQVAAYAKAFEECHQTEPVAEGTNDLHAVEPTCLRTLTNAMLRWLNRAAWVVRFDKKKGGVEAKRVKNMED